MQTPGTSVAGYNGRSGNLDPSATTRQVRVGPEDFRKSTSRLGRPRTVPIGTAASLSRVTTSTVAEAPVAEIKLATQRDKREERAVAASTTCRCGHDKSAHEHYRKGTECSVCECARFRRRWWSLLWTR
jgi:hypothetical protein